MSVNRYKQHTYNTKDVLTLLTAIPIVIAVAVLFAAQVPA